MLTFLYKEGNVKEQMDIPRVRILPNEMFSAYDVMRCRQVFREWQAVNGDKLMPVGVFRQRVARILSMPRLASKMLLSDLAEAGYVQLVPGHGVRITDTPKPMLKEYLNI